MIASLNCTIHWYIVHELIFALFLSFLVFWWVLLRHWIESFALQWHVLIHLDLFTDICRGQVNFAAVLCMWLCHVKCISLHFALLILTSGTKTQFARLWIKEVLWRLLTSPPWVMKVSLWSVCWLRLLRFQLLRWLGWQMWFLPRNTDLHPIIDIVPL